MYSVTLIKDIFTTVTHPEGGFIDPRESKNRVFVCGSLMDPEFVAGIVGHRIATCPAVAVGYTRGYGTVGGKKMHLLMPDPGKFVGGVALLGLDSLDVSKIEEFEQAPAIRHRVPLKLRIGDIELDGFSYMKKD